MSSNTKRKEPFVTFPALLYSPPNQPGLEFGPPFGPFCTPLCTLVPRPYKCGVWGGSSLRGPSLDVELASSSLSLSPGVVWGDISPPKMGSKLLWLELLQQSRSPPHATSPGRSWWDLGMLCALFGSAAQVTRGIFNIL